MLVQELGRANVLLSVMRSTLTELRKAVRGLVVMSGPLEAVAAALGAGRVPEPWLARSFPSLKPLGPYVREVVERCEAFGSWLRDGPPAVYWISGFFFTQVCCSASSRSRGGRGKPHTPDALML